jgi:hypothetical protein
LIAWTRSGQNCSLFKETKLCHFDLFLVATLSRIPEGALNDDDIRKEEFAGY